MWGLSYMPPDHLFGRMGKQFCRRGTILSACQYLELCSLFNTSKACGMDRHIYDYKNISYSFLKSEEVICI
jgi:hypothetical protein